MSLIRSIGPEKKKKIVLLLILQQIINIMNFYVTNCNDFTHLFIHSL